MQVTNKTVFILNKNESPKNHKLKSIEWAIVTQIDGKKNSSEVAKTLSLTEEETQTYFNRLLDLKLIEVNTEIKKVEYLNSSFIQEIEDEMVVLVGPVAPIIVDDILLDMNKNRDNLEKSQIGFFIELVKDEIDDQEKKMKFLEIVLPKINNL